MSEEKKEKFEEYYFSKIGMCGCGSPNHVKNFIYDLLKNHKDYKDEVIDYETMESKRIEIIRGVETDIIFEFIFHVFESANLLEHGGSVYSSWFTDEGDEFLNLLKEFKDNDE
jgi:hypothetical protein